MTHFYAWHDSFSLQDRHDSFLCVWHDNTPSRANICDTYVYMYIYTYWFYWQFMSHTTQQQHVTQYDNNNMSHNTQQRLWLKLERLWLRENEYCHVILLSIVWHVVVEYCHVTQYSTTTCHTILNNNMSHNTQQQHVTQYSTRTLANKYICTCLYIYVLVCTYMYTMYRHYTTCLYTCAH